MSPASGDEMRTALPPGKSTHDRVRSDPLTTVDLSVFTESESYVLSMLTRPVPKQKEDVTLNKL